MGKPPNPRAGRYERSQARVVGLNFQTIVTSVPRKRAAAVVAVPASTEMRSPPGRAAIAQRAAADRTNVVLSAEGTLLREAAGVPWGRPSVHSHLLSGFRRQ